MANDKKYSKRQSRTSYVSTVVGVWLVLLMLGTMGLLILNAKNIERYVKEKIHFELVLNEEIKEVDIKNLKTKLKAEVYVREALFIHKDSAANDLKEDLGEDFVTFLGYNPLHHNLHVYLDVDYANQDSIRWILNEVEAANSSLIYETIYHEDVIEAMNKNINKISLVLFGFSALLLLVSVALINNTIRLAIYSKRFLIKTMQLVGATKSFIQRPFLRGGVLQGLVSAVLAIGTISVFLYLLKDREEFTEFLAMQELDLLGILFGGLIVLGVVISWFSTMLAVRKYIRLKSDDLYR